MNEGVKHPLPFGILIAFPIIALLIIPITTVVRYSFPGTLPAQLMPHFDKLSGGVLLVIGGLLLLANSGRIKFDPFAGVALIMIVMATATGAIYYLDPYEERYARFFLPHISGALLMLTGYLTMRQNPDWSPEQIQKWGKALAHFALILLVVTYPLYLVLNPILAIAFTPTAAIFAMAYFLMHRKPIPVGICMMIVLVSGKRGSLLGMLVLLLVAAIFWLNSNRPSARNLGLACIAGFVFLGLVVVPTILTIDPNVLPGPARTSVSRIQFAAQAVDSGSLNLATAGRFGEIQYSWNDYSHKQSNYWLGTGYGWWFWDFNIIELDGYTNIERQHYVHVSPFNFVYLYGFPLALIFFAVLAVSIVQVWKYAVAVVDTRPTEAAIVLFIIGRLSEGLTGATWLTDPLTWMLLGLMVARSASFAWRPEPSRGALPSTA